MAGHRTDDPTLPGKLSARGRVLSSQTMRLGAELAPILERWVKAASREDRINAWVDVLQAIADDGQRRRADLERQLEQLQGELASAQQAANLAQEHRQVLRAENERLRNLVGEGGR